MWHDVTRKGLTEAAIEKLAAIVEPLLTVRRVMHQQFAVLHKMLLGPTRSGPVAPPKNGLDMASTS